SMGDRVEKALRKLQHPAKRCIEPARTIIASHDAAVIEWIEKDLLRWVGILHQEMIRHAHAGNRKRQPSRYFQIHSRKRDRNADAPLQNVVEETVARIVVILAVSPEAQIIE